MDPCVPLPIEDDILDDLVEKTKDYALMHGICMRRKDAFDRDALHFAPFLLLPTPFPEGEFHKAIELQPILNELMHAVAHDREFLTETLKDTIKVDDFTRRLFELYEKVWDEGITQPLSLGMIRSDLMLNTHMSKKGPEHVYCCWNQPLSLGLFRSDYFHCCESMCIKQVEFNTIASSFGGIAYNLRHLQIFVLTEMGRRDLLQHIPENRALEGLSEAMLKAHKIYNRPKAVILFIVEDVTYNICDQKFHEFEIRKQNPDVWVIRETLTDIARYGSLDDEKRLWCKGKEVAVIYYRCGYSPDQYPTEAEWDARLMMERSLAIKSPSIHYHLAGTKKVQQKLAYPGILERFIKDEEKIQQIRGTFTGLYALDDSPEGNAAFENALADPDRYVVKPQREGGGNNVYGAEIRDFLEPLRNSSERSAYILMDRIHPPITTNYMVRPGWKKAQKKDVVSELGIFGYLIGDSNKIVTNEYCGHMLRTKLSDVNEGGVAAGLGALDSMFLVDLKRCCQEPCNCKLATVDP